MKFKIKGENIKSYVHTDEERQGNKQTGQAIHTDRYSQRQRGRQIDKQTQRQRDRGENRKREIEKREKKWKT